MLRNSIYVVAFSLLCPKMSFGIRIGIFVESADEEIIAKQTIKDHIQDQHDILTAATDSALEAKKQFCEMLESGVMLLVDGTKHMTRIISAYSKQYNVPTIARSTTMKFQGPYSICPQMPTQMVGEAISSLFKKYYWNDISIIYDETFSDFDDISSMSMPEPSMTPPRITIHSMTSNDTDKMSSVLQDIELSSSRVVVLWTSCETAQQLISKAEARSMTSRGYAWLAGPETSQCTGNIFPDGMIGVNLMLNGSPQFLNETTFYQMAAHVIKALVPALTAMENMEVQASCDSNQTFQDGGLIKQFWSSPEEAINVVLINRKYGAWNEMGTWARSTGYVPNKSYQVLFPGSATTVVGSRTNLTDKHIWACVHVDSDDGGWVAMWTEKGKPNWPGWQRHVPRDYIAGYSDAFLSIVADELGFNFSYRYPRDGLWGGQNPTTLEWTGMVRELLEGECEIITSAFTATSVRQRYMDYAAPYHRTGLGFIMRVTEKPECLLCFLKPFSTEIWIFIFKTAMCVALLVFFINKMSPFDHHGSFTFEFHDMARTREARPLLKQFRMAYKAAITELGFSNSIWCSICGLLQQGSEIPMSVSGRIVVASWWFVVMMLMALYTANLAATLTTAGLASEIEDVTDLANQRLIGYGTVKDTSIMSFFEMSNVSLYERMYTWMRRHPNVAFLDSEAEAYNLARTSNFAFVWEKAFMDFEAEKKPCDLKSIGGPFNRVTYNWGLRKYSSYTREISITLLQLQEIGVDEKLKRIWFDARSECPNRDTDSGLQATSVTDMTGVFFVIYGLMLVGTLVMILEFVIACITLVAEGRMSFCDALKYRLGRLNRDFMLYYASKDVQRRQREEITEAANSIRAMIEATTAMVTPPYADASHSPMNCLSSSEFGGRIDDNKQEMEFSNGFLAAPYSDIYTNGNVHSTRTSPSWNGGKRQNGSDYFSYKEHLSPNIITERY